MKSTSLDTPEAPESHLDELDALRRRTAVLEQALAAAQEENARLREDQQKHSLLVDVTNDWIWEVDANAVYTYVSPKIRDFLGYEPEDAIGKTPFDFMPPDEARRVGKVFGSFVSAAQPFKQIENVNLHRDGRRVVLETSGVPLLDEGGKLRGYRGVDRDITARRRAEEERLRLQDEIIRAQAAALAELSTPLIPISDRILVMPLIGTIDTRRAQQILEALLQGVQSASASVAILDITGVTTVDTSVASALIQAAHAVRLLGARVVLTGMRPEVARTVVTMGIELSGLITRGTLKDGIAFASRLR
jgi:rsbT co-antagonist protein RsbR